MSGSKGARASPDLIAACHVLHRLSTPRHPSEALMRLIVLSKTHAADPDRRLSFAGGLTNQACACALCSRSCQTIDVFTCKVHPDDLRWWRRRTDPLFTMSLLSSRPRLKEAGTAEPGQFLPVWPAIDRRSLGWARSSCWWSQTGSNRRPHACKARALPTELWPRSDGRPGQTRTADLTLIRRAL